MISRIAGAWALLIISTQICFAVDERAKVFQDIWSPQGQLAEKEAANLSEKGRAAFQKALVACSLYADNYDNAKYKTECERASKILSVEFGENPSFITVLFRSAMALTGTYKAQGELDYAQGRRRDTTDENLGRVYIEILQKVYRDTRK